MKLKELNGLLEDSCIVIYDKNDDWKRSIYEDNIKEMFNKYGNRNILSIGQFLEYCEPRGTKITLE